MKPDGRNLTPRRALPILRRLSEQRNNATVLDVRLALDAACDALERHIAFGLARAQRRKARAR